MRLKIFEAKTMPEAMAQMRDALGPDALILDSRHTENGVAVTAGIELTPDLPPSWFHRKTLAFHNVPDAISLQLEQHRHDLTEHGEAKPAKSLRRRKRLPGVECLPPEAKMASPNLARPNLQSSLARSLAEVFQFGTLNWDEPLLLIGPPGAGKTLSLVKLAVKLVRQGTPPLVINADSYRAAALPQLGAFTGLLELDLVDAPTPSALLKALDDRDFNRPVLIDSPGINPFAKADIKSLRAICDAAGGTTALVLPAGLDPAESTDLAAAFFKCGATNLIPTRFDLTRRLGGVLAAAAAAPYFITEAGIGPGAADGMTSLTPDLLAHYLYRPYASSTAAESTAP